jgi:hypothetical protein
MQLAVSIYEYIAEGYATLLYTGRLFVPQNSMPKVQHFRTFGSLNAYSLIEYFWAVIGKSEV